MSTWMLCKHINNYKLHQQEYIEVNKPINYEEIMFHNNILSEWQEWEIRSNIYADHFKTFKQFIKIAPSLHPLVIKEKTIFYLNSLLFGVRENIDTWTTYLKHTYPDDNWQNNTQIPCQFKTLISSAYDNNFSYRLFYNLRNYVQHCGTPHYYIEKTSDNRILLSLSANDFVNNYKKMSGSFKKELLTTQQDNIELISLITEYELCLQRLNAKIVTSLVTRNFESIFTASIYLYDQFKELDCPLVLFKYNEISKENPSELNFITHDLLNLEAVSFIKYYVKEFQYTGQYYINMNNLFPVMLEDDKNDLPLILDGLNIVQENNIIWELLQKDFSLSFPNNYYALYYRKTPTKNCNEIICKVLNERKSK